jgi:predicted PurR-regulated permease PerM
MLLARLSSFSLILVLFLFVIVPVAAVLAAITTIVVFVGYCNGTLKNLLQHRESLLSIHSLTKTVRESIKKNTIDI